MKSNGGTFCAVKSLFIHFKNESNCEGAAPFAITAAKQNECSHHHHNMHDYKWSPRPLLNLGREEVPQLGPQTPPLLGAPGRHESAAGGGGGRVVVELDGVVDGRGHLHLDLLVRLVLVQPPALDRDHPLATVGRVRGLSRSLGGLGVGGAGGGRDGGDGDAAPRLAAQTAARPGAAQAAGLPGVLRRRPGQPGRAVLPLVLPEPVRPLEGVAGRDRAEPLLLGAEGGLGRRGVVGLAGQLSHGGEGGHLEGRDGRPDGGPGARLDVDGGADLLRHGERLLRRHGRLSDLGEGAQRFSGVSGGNDMVQSSGLYQ